MNVHEIEAMFPRKAGQRACAYRVPMNMLEEVRAAYKEAGIRVRIRFRGPRTGSYGMLVTNVKVPYMRHRGQAMQDAIKRDATYFCVYTA